MKKRSLLVDQKYLKHYVSTNAGISPHRCHRLRCRIFRPASLLIEVSISVHLQLNLCLRVFARSITHVIVIGTMMYVGICISLPFLFVLCCSVSFNPSVSLFPPRLHFLLFHCFVHIHLHVPQPGHHKADTSASAPFSNPLLSP